MATNKRKTTTAIVAGITALALVLGGTFAWTSISQQARNEAIVDINPGGRLHDDFNGTNKDVYVENFSSGATGVNIYARIKLTEYMEVGPDAGKNKNAEGRNVKVIYPEGAKQPVINDPDTWITYIPAETNPAHTKDVNKTVYTNYWDWELGRTGNLPYYMPTFNMNKDSLLADINGTYEGTVEGDIVHYDNYVEYKADSSKTGTEVYDWDSDLKDEDGGVITGQYDNGGVTTDDTTPIDDADVYHKENQSHTAKQISTDSTVITMAQWIDGGRQTGPFWVYDTDGWAYWAQPIEPQTTTGLLLDSIEQIRVPDDNWYYGIDVVGQFVTASDLSAFENENDGFSDNAKELMGKVAQVDNELVLTGPATIIPGTSANYTTTFKAAGVALKTQPAATWEITNVTAPADAAALISEDTGISINNGTVTVADSVAVGTTFTVKATVGALTKELKVTVADNYEILSLSADGSSLPVPLKPGEAATYKLNFMNPTYDTSIEIDPTKVTLDSVDRYDESTGEYVSLQEGTDYTYDSKTQVLTIANQTEDFSVSFSYPDDDLEAYYYINFLVPRAFPFLVGNLYGGDACVGMPMAAYAMIPGNEMEGEAFYDFIYLDAEKLTNDIEQVLNDIIDPETGKLLPDKAEPYLVNLKDITLCGEYNDGTLYDSEEGFFYYASYTKIAVLMGKHINEDGTEHDVLIMFANPNEFPAISKLSLSDLEKDETTGVYTGTITDGTLYAFMIDNDDNTHLSLSEGHSIGFGGAVIGPEYMNSEEGEESGSLLSLGDYYADDNSIYDEEADKILPAKIYLTARDASNTYQIVLTVVSEPIIGDSVKITCNNLTLENNENGEQENDRAVTITNAGIYDFNVEYDLTLGEWETSVEWKLGPSYAYKGITFDPSTGVLTVEEGATATDTLYFYPSITCGEQEIGYISVDIEIDLNSAATTD